MERLVLLNVLMRNTDCGAEKTTVLPDAVEGNLNWQRGKDTFHGVGYHVHLNGETKYEE